MDVDEVADELYAVPPEEFIAARTARQEEAKAAGEPALAKQIGALGKPSTAAWAANLLVREQRAEIEGLVELGGLLREAQENLAGDQLRPLNAQRAKLLSALTRQAVALAREHGHPVSSAIGNQIEDTLRAAMADPDAGEALLAGRLTAAMSYSGLGTGVRPDLKLVPPPERAAEPHREPGTREGGREKRERDRARRAEEQRRRRELAEARAEVERASADAEVAAEDLERSRRQIDELRDRRDELRDRAAELREEIARLEEEITGVRGDLERAERHSRAAQRAATAAAAERDRAQARVEELEQA